MFPASAPETYSILLADALTMPREGLATLFQKSSRYRVVAQCSEGTTALRLIESDRPDIAVLDLDLPELATLDLVRKIRETQIETRIMILSARAERRTAIDAIRSGANAFVLKSESADRLPEVFDHILRGRIYFSPSFEIGTTSIPSDLESISDDPLRSLSMREFQVFSLLVEGKRPKEIAEQLDLSPKTVDTYRASAMRKLEVQSVAGLVRLAVRRELTSLRRLKEAGQESVVEEVRGE